MLQFILAFSFLSTAQATTLNCEILNNLSVIHSIKIQSALNEKILIGNTGPLVAYVTEKAQNIFIVEGFLADQEARIYAQGPLKLPGESIVASFWNRENIFDISCRK